MCTSSSNPCDQICKKQVAYDKAVEAYQFHVQRIIHGLTITPFLLVLCLWHFIPLYRNQKMFNTVLAVELFFHF